VPEVLYQHNHSGNGGEHRTSNTVNSKSLTRVRHRATIDDERISSALDPAGCGKNKHDPRNHTKQHEMDALIQVFSCDLVDRFTAPT
jgi:hypothetical protein